MHTCIILFVFMLACIGIVALGRGLVVCLSEIIGCFESEDADDNEADADE